MQLILLNRQQGKTTMLIEQSCRTKIPIVVVNYGHKRQVINLANDMGLLEQLPTPIIAYELLERRRHKRPFKVYIDELSWVLYDLLGVKVELATDTLE